MKSEIQVTQKDPYSIVKKIIESIKGFRETTVLLTIIVFSIIMSILSPYFLTAGNLRTTAIGLSADGIIAIGMTLVLISGGVDLAVGAVLGLSGVVAGALYLAGVNIWIGILISILISLLCGVISGIFIGKIKINPLITTLAMMGMARGAAFVATKGSPQSMSGVPQAFRKLGEGSLFGLPIMVLIFLFLAIIFDFMLRKSPAMRKVFYTGSNENTAILSGINTSRVKLGVYTISALLSGIAGILTLSRFGVATPLAGEGTELRVISAAVIGGASLNGGEGTIFGTVLGVVLLNIINNALVLLKVSVYWQTLISGFILILAVTIDQVSHQKKVKKIIN